MATGMSFRKVPLLERLLVCLLLCEKRSFFAKYVGQYRLSVCLFVCLSVRPFAVYSPQYCADRYQFFTVGRSGYLDSTATFGLKSAQGQGQGQHKYENTLLGVTFEPIIIETSDLHQNVSSSTHYQIG